MEVTHKCDRRDSEYWGKMQSFMDKTHEFQNEHKGEEYVYEYIFVFDRDNINEYRLSRLFSRYDARKGIGIARSMFLSSDNNLCFTNHRQKHRGWQVSNFGAELKEIVFIARKPELKETREYKLKKLAEQIHPHAWFELKEQMLNNDESLQYKKLSRNYLKKWFPNWILEKVQDAFDDKTTYQETQYKYGNTGEVSSSATIRIWQESSNGEMRGSVEVYNYRTHRSTVYYVLNPKMATFGGKG